MANIKIKEMKCPCCGASLSLKDNGKGEIIGGSAGFNPGSGWTQLDRK